jgi:hypothetical protein
VGVVHQVEGTRVAFARLDGDLVVGYLGDGSGDGGDFVDVAVVVLVAERAVEEAVEAVGEEILEAVEDTAADAAEAEVVDLVEPGRFFTKRDLDVGGVAFAVPDYGESDLVARFVLLDGFAKLVDGLGIVAVDSGDDVAGFEASVSGGAVVKYADDPDADWIL